MTKWIRVTLAAIAGVVAIALLASPPTSGQIRDPAMPGPQGPAGASGTPGSQIWQTNGVPSPAIGANTDLAVDTTTANVYQKEAGAWTGPTMNLKGPTGATGATGSQGPPGAAAGSSQITTNTAGSGTWTYPATCNSSSKFWAQAQVPAGAASVNVWNVGPPTSTTQTFQISLQVVVSVVGINVLQLNSTPGATTLNVFCQ